MPTAENPLGDPLLPDLRVDGATCAVDFSSGALSWSGMHGGVIVATLVRAAEQVTGARVAAVTAHLHAPVQVGPGRVETTLSRDGRAVISARTRLEQLGDEAATAQLLLTRQSVANADVRQWEFSDWLDGVTKRDPETTPRLDDFRRVMPFAEHVDIRPAGPYRPLAGGPTPELVAWIQPAPTRRYTTAVAAVLLDALAPSLYATRTTPTAIPTVEFTAHFAPVSDVTGWLLIRQRTTWADADFCVDEAQLHTADGRLVAHARQLRRILSDIVPS